MCIIYAIYTCIGRGNGYQKYTSQNSHSYYVCCPVSPDNESKNNAFSSIYSGSSLEPLQITQPLMIKLLENYSIFPDFLQTLFAFGRKPDLAEACSSNVSVGDGGMLPLADWRRI